MIHSDSATDGQRIEWLGLGACFSVTLASMGLGRYIYPLLLPPMRTAMSLTYGQMGLLSTLNLVGYTFFSLAGGAVVGRCGYRWLIGLSLGIVGLASIGAAYAPFYYLLAPLMFAIGAGTGIAYNLALGYVSVFFPARRRGAIMGLTIAGASLGIIISGVLGSVLLARAGWQTVWVTVGLLIAAVALLALLTLRSHALKTSAAVTTETLGAVYRNRRIWLVAVVYFLAGFYAIFLVFYPAFLQDQMNYSQAQVGSLWSLVGLFSGISVFFWGWFSDRVGRRLPLFLAMLITGATLILPILNLQFQSWPLTVFTVALFASCYVAPMGIIPATMADLAGKWASAAIGLGSALFGIGQSLAPGVSGYLIDLTSSFTPGFLLGTAGLWAAAITWWLVPHTAR